MHNICFDYFSQKRALNFRKSKARSIESSTPETDQVTAMAQAIDTVLVTEGETVSVASIDGRKIIAYIYVISWVLKDIYT